MNEILFWTIMTSVAGLISILMFFLGILKKNLKIFILSFAIFGLTICFAIRTTYLVTFKSISRLSEIFSLRDGNEIYTALFDKPSSCVEVMHYQDQIVPLMDYAIYLHFKTCPLELNRLLSLKKYSAEIIPCANLETNLFSFPEWFKPFASNDSVILFSFGKDNYGNGQFMNCTLNSTEVYCKDVEN